MSESLAVLLNNSFAGTLTRSNNGKLRFDYDDDYQAKEEATPLSHSMPTLVSTHPDRVVTPWLWGLLPDNPAVLARWARHFQVSASSPYSILGTPVGEDCAGAVRFVSPGSLDRILERSGSIAWLSEIEVAHRIKELREDSTTWLGRGFTGQFSLAGAQAKTALLKDGERWGLPSGSIPTTHILKPAVAGFHDHDLNEHLCLDAAVRAGIIAVRTKITRFDTQTAVVISRYDRVWNGGVVKRVHQEDLCQALGVSPAKKYQNEGGPNPGDIARLFRRAMGSELADATILRFADALIWNWLIAGTDGHAKNYSVLLANGQIRLAPLYDVASALPYDTHERKLRLAMKVGGDYRLTVHRNTWPAAAKELGVDPDRLVARVRELADVAPQAFVDAAGTASVTELGRRLPGQLVDLVAERAMRCGRVAAMRASDG